MCDRTHVRLTIGQLFVTPFRLPHIRGTIIYAAEIVRQYSHIHIRHADCPQVSQKKWYRLVDGHNCEKLCFPNVLRISLV